MGLKEYRNWIAAAGVVLGLASGSAVSGVYDTSSPPGVEYAQKKAPQKKTQPKKASPKPAVKAPQPRPPTLIDQYARFEGRIEDYFVSLRKNGTLNPTDRLYVTAYDIDHGRPVVTINQDAKVMSASTIKVYVMLAYYDQLDKGIIKAGSNDRALLDAMIKKSSNFATNQLIHKLGGPAKVDLILGRSYDYFNETDVREFIPNGGRTYRNKTSTHDLNIFYNQLWHNKFPVKREYHDRMKAHLSDSGDHSDRLFDRTCLPNGVRVWNKTGTIYGQVSDSGILQFNSRGRGHRYALSVVIEDPTKIRMDNREEPYGKWARERAEVIRSISEGVYDFMATTHNGSYMCKPHKGKHLGGRQ